MTQDTQAGAGAQPAPAIQPEALRIAMHLRQRAQLSRPGNLDTLSASGANELERQHAELSAAKSEAKHWRTNHDNVVSRLRIFTQRPDIPKELADRLPWYRELVRLQEVEAQALPSVVVGPLAERGILDAIRSAYDLGYNDARSARAVPGDSAPGYKGRQVEGDHGGALVHLLKKLQAAPPAPAAVAVPESHTQALKAIAEWPVTDMLLNMDAANMRGIAQRALAAAPAQAVAVPEGVSVDAWRKGARFALEAVSKVDSICWLTDSMKEICIKQAAEAVIAERDRMAAAPAQEHATQLAGEPVAYLDLGAGGYLDIGTDLSDEQLSKLPKGRHMLVIGGTHGVDGYAAAPGEMQKESDAAQLLKKYRKLCLEIGRGDSYHIARIDAAIAAAPAQAQEDARDAGRWRHFSARGVFPKNVWNNGNGHWQYGEIRALTAEGVADAAIASSAEQGGA